MYTATRVQSMTLFQHVCYLRLTPVLTLDVGANRSLG
jgi:hypothetical protein